MMSFYHRLLQHLAFSESGHLAGIRIPPIPWLMTDSEQHMPKTRGGYLVSWGESTSTTYHLTLQQCPSPSPIAYHTWLDSNQGCGAIFDKFLLARWELLANTAPPNYKHQDDIHGETAGGLQMCKILISIQTLATTPKSSQKYHVGFM